MDTEITCLQINLRASKAASVEVNTRSEEIVFITEPYCAARKYPMLLNRANTQVLAHAGQERPRAALRVSKELHPWMVPEFSDRDVCVVACKIQTRLVYVCSLYLDIELEVHRPNFLKLVDRCQTERIPMVVGMDSNAHSPMWEIGRAHV